MRSFLIAMALVAVAPGLPATPAASALAAAPATTAPCSSGHVALTFDDGPSATVTPRLVRILKEARVPATFFMVGERVASAPAAARLVDSSGFLVANHSYRHEDMTRQNSAQVRATLSATRSILRRARTRPTGLMRPPYGAIDDRVRGAIRAVGLLPVLWDVDPRDWEGASSGVIASRILAGLRPGRRNIVLQHDGIANSPASVAAVPRVVREARARGYCFVALDENGQPGFPTPRATLSVTNAAEGRRARATVQLDKPTARVTTVRLTTRSRTATSGADFAGRSVVLRFPAGTTKQHVRISVLRDRVDEATERFDVTLSQGVGVRLGTSRDDVVVTDRNALPSVGVLERRVVEPVGAPVRDEVRVRLGTLSGRTVRVLVRSVTGTASTADFEPFRVWVRIPAGAREARVPVTVLPDDVEEAPETFAVRILDVSHASYVDRDVPITITPPSPSPPRVRNESRR